MNSDLRALESSISKKHRFNWTPSYTDTCYTRLGEGSFLHLVENVFIALDWSTLLLTPSRSLADRKGALNRPTERITVSLDHGTVTVKSESLGNEFWDNGRNSKRVGLFIAAFQRAEQQLDGATIRELDEQFEKETNWEHYVVPETLPVPHRLASPLFWVSVLGGIFVSVLLGLLLGLLRMNGFYIFGLVEWGVVLALSYSLIQLAKAGNYAGHDRYLYLLVLLIPMVYLSSYLLGYFSFLETLVYNRISFVEYLDLQIRSSYYGLLGWSLNLAFQGIFTFVFAFPRVMQGLTVYQIQRIPEEVLDFVCYLVLHDHSEEEIRYRLAEKGWTERQNQDEVFEALGAIQLAEEMI